MTLPKFPQFKNVDLSCQKVINDFLLKYHLEASEYTFTNIFAFRFTYNFKISIIKNNLMILKDVAPVSMFCQIGNTQISDVLHEAVNYLRNYKPETDYKPYMERMPEGFVNVYLKNNRNFTIEEDCNQFDYVYDVKELIELKGSKFHDKRNQVNKFR